MERRKWTVWTSITTLSIAIALAVATISIASQNISQRNATSDVNCTSNEWLWVINQLQNSSSAPASIQVLLSGGGSITVPLSQLQNKNAHYRLDPSDIPAGETPVGATAVIYDGWSGNFVLSHCAAAPSPSPSPAPSPSPTPEPTPNPTPEPSPVPSPSPSPGL